MERIAATDLKADLSEVTKSDVRIEALSSCTYEMIVKTQLPGYAPIIIGVPDSNPLVHDWSTGGIIPVSSVTPGKRGGGICPVSLQSSPQKPPFETLVLVGSDPQGCQYAVYEFSRRDLGIDPCRYWTGIPTRQNPTFSIRNVKPRLISPPLVPILCYFDNDNDELANLTPPFLEFSWEQWQALIQMLVRLKYNAIDIHDHLGRAEFYRWPYYKALRPDYTPNIDLLNRVIDYAHERGVMIQTSFYLGWKFRVISDKASLNWKKYKSEWLEIWNYYLNDTPIGKCDIFLNRPRDQRWDRKYQGKGVGNDPVTVFNEVFPEMYRLIKNHNPNAVIVIDLYSEGRKVFRDGLAPEPKAGFIMVWPDNGFGEFEYMPEDLKGYEFGIYMHAGYYRNHVVADPYPQILAKSMKSALNDFQMTQYCLVNGQTVRHYLINLEACSLLCDNPAFFDPDLIYLEWATRYFSAALAPDIVRINHLLHQAQEGYWGYIDLMSWLKASTIRARLRKAAPWLPWTWINRKFEQYGRVGTAMTEATRRNIQLLETANDLCEKIRANGGDPFDFLHDFLELPVKLLLSLNRVGYFLQVVAYQDNITENYNQAIKYVKVHHELRLEGDRQGRWKGWYDPARRRPNGGYFDMNLLLRKNIIMIHKNR
jgi:hypothetical protein